ncbi:MAG: hypothetical protein QOF73_1727, partial [Thermomicrobiales bacterium]|nr:hypothetical protein [Thermomicrobiales bacterium]
MNSLDRPKRGRREAPEVMRDGPQRSGRPVCAILVIVYARISPFDVSLPLLVGYLLRNSAPGRDPIAAFAGGGVRLGFIQPSRRIRIAGPDVP